MSRAATLAAPVLVIAVAAALVSFGWFGYRAVDGWRSSAAQLAAQRATEAVDRLVTALSRDMRGVHATVLTASQLDQFMMDPPYDVRASAASAFARYPYAESFFAWRGTVVPSNVILLNRSDRRPAWMPGPSPAASFPVVVEYNPEVASLLMVRVQRDAAARRRFSAFEVRLGQVAYQVVARLLYRDALRQHFEGALGFTVNLGWVRRSYFPEMTQQVARIAGGGSLAALAVVDERGEPVAGTASGVLSEPTTRRGFPLWFFDPDLVGLGPPEDLERRQWMAVASAGVDPTLSEAMRGSRQTLLIAGMAALILALGSVLTIRATQARARLVELRSEFVQSVTHELRTPIASIRATGETLARGRVSGSAAQREYALLVVQEAKRLSRLVDNLLAYARITDVTEAYTFEPIELRPLVEDALAGFRGPLGEAGFHVHVDVDHDLPAVRADRTSCLLLLDNLIDNAIRYSKGGNWLAVCAKATGRTVVIDVTDRGMGIAPEELPRVTRRFFRGRGAGPGGSGLGLAIVDRIVKDHGGRLKIHSTVGVGTTVTLTLPADDTRHEQANPGR